LAASSILFFATFSASAAAAAFSSSSFLSFSSSSPMRAMAAWASALNVGGVCGAKVAGGPEAIDPFLISM
jgi:hypothetical protein